MSILKCKMCGGTVEFENGATVGICDSCGTKQTLPRLDDERKANLYDRANHFRRNNEYDKAMSIFEQILNEDKTDAESYWSIVLCKYGIEYVEDQTTHKRVPTLNRTQHTSVVADEDYKKALKYASIEQKIIYEEEAKAIDEIQKGILEISKKEDPFDVFICYKETDSNGRRTQDSVLANDLYHQLTQEGFKVFFSRITLEDKLGTEYEPYIFAALNSAKVMVVLGTKPEYFNSVWVKNEWNRYLALIKNGEKKTLIPAYKDMDPYDLPEEFSHLQAQDMSKLGFMQDLTRGIKKIAGEEKQSASTIVAAPVAQGYSANITALLKRGNIALEDQEWDRAKQFFDDVLNMDAECAEAYLGLAMADYEVDDKDDIAFLDDIDKDKNYKRAKKYASDSLRAQLDEWDQKRTKRIKEKIERERKAESERKAREKRAETERKRAETERKNKLSALQKQIENLDSDPNIYTVEQLDTIRELEADLDSKKVVLEKAKADYDQCEDYRRDCELKIIELNDDTKAKTVECNRLSLLIQEKKKCVKKLGLFKKTEKEVLLQEISLLTNTLHELANSINENNNIISEFENTLVDQERITQNKMKNQQIAQEALRKSEKSLDDFKKSVVEPKRMALQIETYKMTFCVGNCITLGHWPNNIEGKPIEWLVLDRNDDGSCLLISNQVIDLKKYNEGRFSTTWAECSLRKFLNSDFYKKAFSDEEKKMIKKSYVEAEYNLRYDTDPGKDTYDYVFLLSIKEAEKYFKSSDERKCKPCKNLIDIIDVYGDGFCCWWLRSPGIYRIDAAFVNPFGDVDAFGQRVNDNNGVRPALWINLEQ